MLSKLLRFKVLNKNGCMRFFKVIRKRVRRIVFPARFVQPSNKLKPIAAFADVESHDVFAFSWGNLKTVVDVLIHRNCVSTNKIGKPIQSFK